MKSLKWDRVTANPLIRGVHLTINGMTVCCHAQATTYWLDYKVVARNYIAHVLDDEGEVREIWGRWEDEEEWIRLL